MESNHLMNTYARLPVSFDRGDGAWLWDVDGRRYLDAISGIAVCNLGHAHPEVRDAVCAQAGRLIHTSNIYGIELQGQLGSRLCQLSGMDRVFFGNSGAEANEAAIKLSRLYGHARGIDDPTLIVMKSSFHGRTMATLSATGSRKAQAGFEPLVSGFVRVPFDDLESIRKVAESRSSVVGVMVEPIQGEGGVNVPDTNYLIALRELCDQHDWLLILDEIQTGMGRTGRWFAHHWFDPMRPDVMTIAKALGNGFPIGACLARGEAAELFTHGTHGTTFGGNPLASCVALTVLEVIERDQLWERAAEMGRSLKSRLQRGLNGVPGVVDIRGSGLMLGVELDRPCASLVHTALERGVLINVTAGNVVRLLPPLVLDAEQAEQIGETVVTIVRQLLEQS